MNNIQDISVDKTAVRLSISFPHLTPQQLFDYFTDPELLIQWWSQEAETDVVEGGVYEIRWPAMNWTLRGNYTAVDPSHHLAFTWQWDHQPDLPQRTVSLSIKAKETGSQLQIEHGRYTPSDVDQEDRQSHIDGWLHFLPILQGVSALAFFKARLAQSQTAFLTILHQTSKDNLYQKQDVEGWTPATILAHICDGRSFYAKEVARLANEQGGTFGRPLTDQHRIETIEKGNSRSISSLEKTIQQSFELISITLNGLQPDHLSLECQHPAYGNYTLGEIIGRFLVGHDQIHVNQIRDILNG